VVRQQKVLQPLLDGIITNMHIFLSLSCSFLFSGWLMATLFQQMSYPTVRSQKLHTHWQNCLTFKAWKNRDIRLPKPNFAEHRTRAL